MRHNSSVSAMELYRWVSIKNGIYSALAMDILQSCTIFVAPTHQITLTQCMEIISHSWVWLKNIMNWSCGCFIGSNKVLISQWSMISEANRFSCHLWLFFINNFAIIAVPRKWGWYKIQDYFFIPAYWLTIENIMTSITAGHVCAL